MLFDVDGTLFDYAASEEAGLLAHLAAEPPGRVLEVPPGPWRLARTLAALSGLSE
ncbi:hypothetical protein [Streptomyces sp. NPDC087270]|uniref:hypothetical protein n=1 Tax=Streptomyces sp. NPDC087270 TaxID=3365774 RepID=UPI0038173060